MDADIDKRLAVHEAICAERYNTIAKSLKEGDLLFFKKPELATIYIGDLPAFECQVGMAGPNVAIRIEKSLDPETI